MRMTTRCTAAAAIIVLVLSAASAEGNDHVPADSPNCQSCELIAKGLEIELNKLEEPNLEGLSESEMAQRCESGR